MRACGFCFARRGMSARHHGMHHAQRNSARQRRWWVRCDYRLDTNQRHNFFFPVCPPHCPALLLPCCQSARAIAVITTTCLHLDKNTSVEAPSRTSTSWDREGGYTRRTPGQSASENKDSNILLITQIPYNWVSRTSSQKGKKWLFSPYSESAVRVPGRLQ
jgi:hypothetical protein